MSDDIDLLEAFALGDRASVVKERLVPGSASHFHYASLLSEQSGFPAELEASVADWKSSNSYSAPVGKAKARKAFVELTPEALAKGGAHESQALLSALGVAFNHSQVLPRFEQAVTRALPNAVRVAAWLNVADGGKVARVGLWGDLGALSLPRALMWLLMLFCRLLRRVVCVCAGAGADAAVALTLKHLFLCPPPPLLPAGPLRVQHLCASEASGRPWRVWPV